MGLRIFTAKLGLFFKISLFTLIIWIAVDQLIRITLPQLVFPDHFNKDNVLRYPAPYIEFKGKPNALHHNEFGYRWDSKRLNEGAIKIAFFGGSTGYLGNPPIADILEQKLGNQLHRPVHIANFSVVSSNHRQHLHNIIESNALFKPDIIIFYGGFNETGGTAFYDPRPGYPYNYFFRNETPDYLQWLISRSPIVYLLDRAGTKFGIFSLTPIFSLRKEVDLNSQGWRDNIVTSYFETLHLAKTVTNAFYSDICSGSVEFRFFYQPYRILPELEYIDSRIREKIKTISYGFDVSDTFDGVKEEVFTDVVHINQDGNLVIADIISKKLVNDKSLEHCWSHNGY